MTVPPPLRDGPDIPKQRYLARVGGDGKIGWRAQSNKTQGAVKPVIYNCYSLSKPKSAHKSVQETS